MIAASIVICTRNRAPVVVRAIHGALAEAASAGAELLVVDNASTDATPSAVAELQQQAASPFRVLREPEVGLSAARNRGLKEACGDIVAFLDDDAVPRKGWLAALLACVATCVE